MNDDDERIAPRETGDSPALSYLHDHNQDNALKDLPFLKNIQITLPIRDIEEISLLVQAHHAGFYRVRPHCLYF
jgi:hypothetical protein